MAEQINPRSLVVDILLAVDRDGTFFNIAFRDVADRFSELSRRDRSFIRRVSGGTIEREIELDYILNQFSDTKVNKMKPVIRAILRSGVYQLLYMESVPDSAVCNEAVRLAVRRGLSGLSGFVNGVLRTIARSRDAIVYPSPEEDPVRALSVRYSMPEWITERLESEYGTKRCGSILSAYLDERPVCFRVDTRTKTAEEVRASLESQGIRVKADTRLPYAFFLEGFESLERIPEFADGTIYAQDIASMMVVDLAAPEPGDRVIDVCAAPGGKSIHAAQAMCGTGEVLARDLTEAKTALIRENIRRCRVPNVRAEVWDARIFDPEWEEAADLVLADLPCSGLGVIGRKPDIKYRVRPEDVRELAAQQREILTTVRRYVKPGGTLLYSTCTITAEEDQENVQWFLDQFPGFTLTEERMYLPDEGCDGFYLAKLTKTTKSALHGILF